MNSYNKYHKVVRVKKSELLRKHENEEKLIKV
jgi:hypothetical protein